MTNFYQLSHHPEFPIGGQEQILII